MRNPFRRNKDVSAVPAEIQEYYQAERRERTGIAWLLALGTLLITIGLATLLFFGGRWAYRAIVNNDDRQEVAQVEDSQDEPQTSGEGATQDVASDSGATTTPTGTSSTSTSTPNNLSGSTQGAVSTPVTGDTLPNTGAGDVLSVFIVVTVLSAIAYEFSRRHFA